MSEDRSPIDNVEIEPLSDEDLQGVAGGNDSLLQPGDGSSTPTTSTGPSCCSCSNCS